MRAPACGIDGCTTPSWGTCERHTISSARSAAQVIAEAARLFPSIVDLASLRKALYGTVQLATTDQCSRYFPLLDVADAQLRHDKLAHLRLQLMEELCPTGAPASFEQAYQARMGERDTYGPKFTDMVTMTSYLAAAEWELGRATDAGTGQFAMPYDVPWIDFSDAVGEVIAQVAFDSFALTAQDYHAIVQAAGRPALNDFVLDESLTLPYAVLKHQRDAELAAERARQEQADRKAARAAEKAQRQERADAMAAKVGGLGSRLLPGFFDSISDGLEAAEQAERRHQHDVIRRAAYRRAKDQNSRSWFSTWD